MISDILIPLGTVAIAELGDKTQIAILLLSSKTKKHLHLLLGVILAFLIVDGAAILVGSYAMNIISIKLLKILSGGIFIIYGTLLLILKEREDDNKNRLYSANPFLSGFGLILITEWGDKTQIAAGLFATQYKPWFVLIGTIAALTILSIMAVYLGKFISEKIDKKKITRSAGIIFLLIGISFFLL